MIIALNGYSGSGKDSVAAIIQYLMCDNVGTLEVEDIIKYYKTHKWWLENQSEWEIKKFAGKLKTIASLLTGIPVDMFEDQKFKKKELPPEWSRHGLPMTVREFLQRLGTNAIRDKLCDNAWLNALMVDYIPKNESNDYPNWIITDCRFPNEAYAVKSKNGVIIRIDRPGLKPTNDHSSETSLDHWNFDYKIMNGSDFTSLAFTVATILKKMGYEPKRIPEYTTGND